MSPVPKYQCAHCTKTIVGNYYAQHIFNLHINEIFDLQTPNGRNNRKILHRESSLKKPVLFRTDLDDDLYYCLGCMTACKKSAMAYKHMLKCQVAHENRVRELRDILPITPEMSTTEPVLTEAVMKTLKEALWEVLYEIRQSEEADGRTRFYKIPKRITEKLPFDVSYEALKAIFDPKEST